MLTHGITADFRGGVHLFILTRHTPSVQSRVNRITQVRTDGAHCRESAGTGPVVLKVVPVTGAAICSIVLRSSIHNMRPDSDTCSSFFFFFLKCRLFRIFPYYTVFSLYGVHTSHVSPFRMLFFYLVTTGCIFIFDISFICMYVCMVLTYSRVWINRVWLLLILLVVS